MRILALNPDLPVFPGRAGHEHLQATSLRALGHRVGLVSLLHSGEQDAKQRSLSDRGVDLFLWRSPHLDGAPPRSPGRRGPRRALAAAYRLAAGFTRPLDTIVQDYQFRNIAPALTEALAQADWTAVVVVQSNCARWLHGLPSLPLSVLVLHDVRSLVYARRAVTRTLPGRARDLAESLRYARFERAYCRQFDLVVTVSSADEAWVRKHYRPRDVVTVPIPVDRSYFQPPGQAAEVPGRIVFTGMMDHPPNVDAACHFAAAVLPGVRARVPSAEFWIVGRDPSPSVRALAGRDGVRVTGLVEDIRPHMAAASVIVVPLRFGSGMRNKILEAWAMEKCVVSTTVGAEGLDARDGANLLVADTDDAFAARVVEALQDGAIRARLGLGGARAVAAHDPAPIASRYAAALAERTGAKRARTRMHALVDLRWMRPGEAGGIETLSRSFVERLLAIDRCNRYTLALPACSRYEFDLRANPNASVVVADGPGRDLASLRRRAAARLRAWARSDDWRSPEVERLWRLRRLGANVGLSIPGYIHPDMHALPTVLVMPDIQHEDCPQFFTPQALEERRRIYRDAVARARHVCAISHFTRRSLVERLGVPPGKVTTTPLAAGRLFLPGSPALGRKSAVTAKYGLTAGDYLLFPGHTWPHKNHLGALEALRLLAEQHGLRPQLVLTGAAREADGHVQARVRELGLSSRVRFLGYCPDTDMPGLYEGAAALLFPSFYEGFGIPVLEAMWCGCPVVCSDGTSLPEIAGPAARLVDPRSPEAIAAAAAEVLTDTALRQELVERGRRQAARFSWGRFTLGVLGCLRDVFESQWS